MGALRNPGHAPWKGKKLKVWRRNRPIREFDVIVVLGAAVRHGGRPSPAMYRRMMHGVELFRQGKARQFLVTGGLGHYPPSQAEVMRDIAIAEGVPGAQIHLEDSAQTTLESATHTAVIMRQNGWTRALVVTDSVHLPRTLLAFRSAGLDTVGSGVRSAWRQGPFRHWTYYVFYELTGFAWYALLILVGRHRHAEPASR